MKRWVERALRAVSVLILKRYRPMVIGVTGSVGKTSAKQAIFAVVSSRYRARATEKNYNNEIGVPLTIIGVHSPGRSLVGWVRVFARGVWLIVRRCVSYPEVLVLEMGADRPGDIAYLTSLAPAHIGVITAIGEAHYEFFRDVESIYREKSIMVKHLGVGDIAIVNGDDALARRAADEGRAGAVRYGMADDADVQAADVHSAYSEIDGRRRVVGLQFRLRYHGSYVPVLLPGVVGMGHVGAALAAAAVGVALGMHLIEIAERLSRVEFPCGRMRILDGVRHLTIIDDTYNASPLAMVFALDALRDIKIDEGSRRIAVLGDMLELGAISEQSHRDIGHRIQAFNVDWLVVVGVASQWIADEAIAAGFDASRVRRFEKADDAGRFVRELVREGDVILVKGSQGVRLESVVVEIMADARQAERLVCRQSEEWL